MKVCNKTCIFFFFPIINKYSCMAKRSLLYRCPSYYSQEEITKHGLLDMQQGVQYSKLFNLLVYLFVHSFSVNLKTIYSSDFRVSNDA